MSTRQGSLLSLFVLALDAAALAGPTVPYDQTFSANSRVGSTTDGFLMSALSNTPSADALSRSDVLISRYLDANPTPTQTMVSGPLSGSTIFSGGVGAIVHHMMSGTDIPTSRGPTDGKPVIFTLAGTSIDAISGRHVGLQNVNDVTPTPSVTPTPVPGAALLGMLGLGVVGWVKHRFAK